MTIKFTKIKWKNLLSYGDYWSEFLFSSGIDLVIGENGNGKSVLSEAVFYSLFGKPYRKIKLASLVNREKGKGLEVEIEFESDGKEYKIIRGNKPPIFEIYEKNNGVYSIIEQRATVKEYQSMLENDILKVNETIFRQLVILGANLPSSKPFLELSQHEKEEIFQVVTDTSIFGYMNIVIKNKLQELKIQLKDLDYKKEVLESSIKSEEIVIKQAEDRNKFFENSRDEKISDCKNKIESTIKEIEQINLIIENLKMKKEEYVLVKGEIEKLEEKLQEEKQKDSKDIDVLKKEQEKLNEEINDINQRFDDVIRINVLDSFLLEQKEIEDTSKEIIDIQRKIQDISAAKTSSIKCSKCGEDNYLKEFLETITKEDIENETLYIERLRILETRLDKLRLDLENKISLAEQDKKNRIEEMTLEKKKIYSDINAIEIKINEIKSKIVESLYPSNLDILEKQKRSDLLKTELIEGKHRIQQKEIYNNNLGSYKKELQELEQISAVDIDYTEFNRKKDDLKYTNELLLKYRNKEKKYKELLEIIGSGNLKGFIIKYQIPFLNKSIQYFLELFSMLDYNFVIDENFKEQIIARDNDNEFNQLSNGQKARISFSIMFAFLKLIEERNGVKTNLLILDEILDSSVDNTGRDDLLNILRNEFSSSKDIVIISHNPEIKEKADIFNRVVVISKDVFSKIQVE